MRLKLLALAAAFAGTVHGAAPAPASFNLTLVDLQGQKKVLGPVTGSSISPRVSPDGKRVALDVSDPPVGANAPVTRLQVSPLDKLTESVALEPTVTTPYNAAPVWSADGDWIVFVATGNGADALYRQLSDGWIQPKYVADGNAPDSLSDKGVLAFTTRTGERDYGITLMDLNTRAKTRIDQPGSAQHGGDLSPDGNWIAYTSDETGRPEIWVEPVAQQAGQRVQLTRQGGQRAQWSPDGTAIYFDQGGRIFRISVTRDGGKPTAGAVTELPITGFQQGGLRRQYDLMPDGTGFVMLFPAG